MVFRTGVAGDRASAAARLPCEEFFQDGISHGSSRRQVLRRCAAALRRVLFKILMSQGSRGAAVGGFTLKKPRSLRLSRSGARAAETQWLGFAVGLGVAAGAWLRAAGVGVGAAGLA